MKEFVEKLIEKLEKEYEYQLKKADECEKKEAFEMISVSKSRRKNAQCFDAAIQVVKQLAEEYNNGWIPCSERLPEYTDEYNVTVDVASEFGCYKTATTLRFENIKGREPKWVIPYNKLYRVIAWKPLPEPFKPIAE